MKVNFQGIDTIDQLVTGKINVLNIWKEGVSINLGQPDQKIGRYAAKSFETAFEALNENKIDALITAPIDKSLIQSETFTFKGHTDYIESKSEQETLMILVNNQLRIALLTDHVPLKEVSNLLTQELVAKKVRILNHSLKQDFGISKPKIAVLGINPHCGDNGVIGNEDNQIILPAVTQLNENGILVYGPYAADGFFGSKQYEKFDAILAVYHDQGLTPFKTLSFGNGVNFTAGFSQIRTSPDHGTGFDIAGQKKADPTSFREAVYLAIDIKKKRNEYNELTSNTLQSSATK